MEGFYMQKLGGTNLLAEEKTALCKARLAFLKERGLLSGRLFPLLGVEEIQSHMANYLIGTNR